MTSKISLCWLDSYPTLEKALLDKYTKSTLKKYLTRKELNRKIQVGLETQLPLDLINHKEINCLYGGEDLEIIFEDDLFLALEKPPGMHGHPLLYSDTQTVLNYIAKYRPKLLKINSIKKERGLLYRLDAQTSGVLVYVKNEEVWRELRQGFNDYILDKIYEAVVEGEFPNISRLHHNLKPSGAKGKLMVESSEGDECQLEVMANKFEKGKSFLKLKLKEGRRHQIRAQLAALGFPILGDTFYGGKKASRLYLHARLYHFKWKKEYQIESKIKVLSLEP